MIPIFVKLSVTPDPAVSARALSRISKAAHTRQGEHWHKHILPAHFRSGAASKYNYRPLKAATIKRKQREAQKGRVAMGGTVPRVWTGSTRRSVTEFASIRGFPSRVRINVHAPRYIPERPRSQKQPPIGEELMRLTSDDKAALEKVLADNVIAGLRRIDKTTIYKAG